MMSAFLLYGLALVLLVFERALAHPNRVAVQTRWLTNLSLWLLAGATASLLLPGGLPSLAVQSEPLAPGRLVLEVLVIVLVRDFLSYWEHRLMHRVPLGWRLHRVHHTDTALDVTTAQRHHPLEIVIHTGVAAGVVLALGFSAAALGIALLVAGFSTVYTHTSLTLPKNVDRSLRLVFMTPSAHRIHHSTRPLQTDSNYATVFTFWDRLFGTYRDPAQEPVPGIGLNGFAGDDEATLLAVLAQPLRSPLRDLPGDVPAADEST